MDSITEQTGMVTCGLSNPFNAQIRRAAEGMDTTDDGFGYDIKISSADKKKIRYKSKAHKRNLC